MENQSLDETNQSLDKAYVDYLITPTVSGNIVNKAVFKKLRFPSDTQRDFFLNAVSILQQALFILTVNNRDKSCRSKLSKMSLILSNISVFTPPAQNTNISW
jgi:hypothetical protein